ncbi:S1 family peptidase [Streptomyces triculaminicus]|uniref:S1 family peptidase n=1 Tax=Streptomyces triculaminicus TaxID=2816232 RepID=UPI0037CD323F
MLSCAPRRPDGTLVRQLLTWTRRAVAAVPHESSRARTSTTTGAPPSQEVGELNHSRIPRLRTALAVAGAAALATTSLTTHSAGAATPGPAVTPTATALASAQRALDADAAVPGTTTYVDHAAGKVVVTVDRTVEGAALAKVRDAVAALGDRATVKRTAGTLRPLIAGGDAIWGSGVRCSLGFNVTKGGKPYFLTAGHCGNASASWSESQGGSRIGTTEKASFPGNDYALVKYTATTDHPSAVDLYDGGRQEIAKAGEATVGEHVSRSGSTTQVHDGEVTALDVTVNYQEGQVTGLIGTTVCAEPGDSGGALFDGDTALGLTSGGSGDCSSGGETFFQPVPAALGALGAQLP